MTFQLYFFIMLYEIVTEIDELKLKHARVHNTYLSDERLDIVCEELQRIARAAKDY